MVVLTKKKEKSMPAYTTVAIYKKADIQGRPRLTVAIGKTPSGKFVRGLAICKADEKIDETTGVNKARGRMKAAILHRTKREPIKHKVMGRNFKFKSAFDVEPTLFEEMLIAAEQV